MNRIATTLITLTACATIAPFLPAQDGSVPTIESRMANLESRLEALEQALLEETGSYSYQEQATLEATNSSYQKPTTPASAEGSTYKIQEGDTLGSIASKHGVERAALLEANRLSEGQPIYIGETLVIPGVQQPVSPVAPPAPPKQEVADSKPTPAPANQKSVVVGEAGQKTHTVVKNDTLTKLAKLYGTDIAAIKTANGLKSDEIALGQVLKIPTTAPIKNAATASTTTQSNEYQYDNPLLRSDETYGFYTVKDGDNLYALARDFFSNMAELQRLNKLGDSTLIYPGNELIVPTSKYNSYHNKEGVASR